MKKKPKLIPFRRPNFKKMHFFYAVYILWINLCIVMIPKGIKNAYILEQYFNNRPLAALKLQKQQKRTRQADQDARSFICPKHFGAQRQIGLVTGQALKRAQLVLKPKKLKSVFKYFICPDSWLCMSKHLFGQIKQIWQAFVLGFELLI